MTKSFNVTKIPSLGNFSGIAILCVFPLTYIYDDCNASMQDQFEIAYSNYSQQTVANAVSVAYIAPALTPRSVWWLTCLDSISELLRHRWKSCVQNLRCRPGHLRNHGLSGLH